MALTMLPLSIRLRRAARRHFGWRRLRTGQLAAMRAVLKRRDALVVLPTGHGKSAVYQVPATLLSGPTVVVSPLLALQQDQLAGLNGRDDARLAAVRVSSAETPAQQRAALEAVRSGAARFLFITPEQLGQPDRLAEIKALRPALVAVDEAHCISAWGHDFRPDYLQLGHVVRELGRPPVVALTATASPPVREDIVARLRLRGPRLVIAGLDRPNLYLESIGCVTEADRWKRLLVRLRAEEPPGIVYAPTRRVAEDLADRLVGEGIKAQAYHGGMAAGERTRRHEAFLTDEVPVMVATSAFGMGIDKPNIRWIVHVALPDSPDSYLQEIGRAGRDGAPARALLLHRPEDVALQRFFVGAPPERAELTRLARALRDGPVRKSDLCHDLGLSTRRLASDLALLERVGAAMTVQDGRVTAPRYAAVPEEAVSLALREARRQQTVQRSRTDMMSQFAQTTSCRGQYLLAYFGEHLAQPCGHCDNCSGGLVPRPRRSAENVPYPVHSTVTHAEWGSGMVLRYERDRMIVLFDDVGYKTLSVPVVVKRGLLSPAP
jgi:ATP-dependent DNA helicase RecQ